MRRADRVGRIPILSRLAVDDLGMSRAPRRSAQFRPTYCVFDTEGRLNVSRAGGKLIGALNVTDGQEVDLQGIGEIPTRFSF